MEVLRDYIPIGKSCDTLATCLRTRYDKARAFYEGALGCEFVSLDQFALVVKFFRGKEQSELGAFSISLAVKDIEASRSFYRQHICVCAYSGVCSIRCRRHVAPQSGRIPLGFAWYGRCVW